MILYARASKSGQIERGAAGLEGTGPRRADRTLAPVRAMASRTGGTGRLPWRGRPWLCSLHRASRGTSRAGWPWCRIARRIPILRRTEPRLPRHRSGRPSARNRRRGFATWPSQGRSRLADLVHRGGRVAELQHAVPDEQAAHQQAREHRQVGIERGRGGGCRRRCGHGASPAIFGAIRGFAKFRGATSSGPAEQPRIVPQDHRRTEFRQRTERGQ